MKVADAWDFGKCNRVEELAGDLVELVQKAAVEGQELHSVERGVLDALLEMGHVVMDQFLQQQGKGDLGDTIESADGDLAFRGEETAQRVFRTMFGLHEIGVFVYRKGRHPNTPIVFRPIDARLGVSTAQWSPLLQETTQILAVEQSFDCAAESFERIFRQRLSVDTMETVNQQMGLEAAAYFEALPVPPKSEEGTVLVETGDGKGVPLVKADAQRLAAFEERPVRPGNRRMATLAAVYSVDRHLRTPEDIVAALFRDPDELYRTGRVKRPVPCHKQIIARFPAPIVELDPTLPVSGTIHAFGWAAQQVLQRRRPGQELVCLGDGQKSLWDTMASFQGDKKDATRVEILDVIHASGYVWRAAKVFHTHKESQEAFARDYLLRILQGKVKQVVVSLRARARRYQLTRAEKKEITTVCRYFTTNAARMRYHEYLAKGYPIATGVIEGACRHLVKDRMERTGMRWTQANAQAMLDVRALYQSSYWDELQAGRATTARTRYTAYLHLLSDLKTLAV